MNIIVPFVWVESGLREVIWLYQGHEASEMLGQSFFLVSEDFLPFLFSLEAPEWGE